MGVLLLVVAGVTALAHTAPFPFLLELFHRSRSMWRVTSASDAPATIYLTFDDGPNPDWTPALLDTLQDHHVRATFFLIDDHITAETAPVVKRIADEGHAIGLHSGNRWLMLDGADAMSRKIEDAAARIKCHHRPRAMSPLSTARGLAQRGDVRRLTKGRLHARRLVVGDVGLELVAWPQRRPLGGASCARARRPARSSSSMTDIMSTRERTAGTR